MKRNLNTLTGNDVKQMWMDVDHEDDTFSFIAKKIKDTFASDSEPVDDETLERVIREAIETWHTNEDVNGMNLSAYIEKAIRPYTRGFVPDWDKAPEWATGIAWYFVVGSDPQFESPKAKWAGWSRRLTPPKQRVRKSNEELAHDLWRFFDGKLPEKLIVKLASGQSIESICKDYGVDLEKEV